jgi:hypothetical protein
MYGESVVLEWDGNDWTSTPFQQGDLTDIDMVSGTDGWAIGSEAWRWDGSAWITMTHSITTNPNIQLQAIDMISATDGWIIGSEGTPPQGVVFHWDGSSWSIVPISLAEGLLDEVVMVSADDGWIFGSHQSPAYLPFFLHWDGNSWTEFDSHNLGSLASFYSADFSSPSNGWAVGDRFIDPVHGYAPVLLQWNGTMWTEVEPPVSQGSLESLSFSSEHEAWAVGSRYVSGRGYEGPIILHWSCNQWTGVNSPSYERLHYVDMVSATDGWAVGDDGTLLRYTGSSAEGCAYFPVISR